MKVFAKAALLLALFVPVAQAQESSTPYEVLYGVLMPAQEAKKYDRLRAIERVRSKSATVAASEIRLSIHAKSGVIPIPIAADGTISFPMDAALKAENPPVVSNQPKGSLGLTITFELRLPPGLRIPYTEVVAALTQAREMVAKYGVPGAAPGEVPKVGGVEFRFLRGKDASVTIAGKTERLLVADESGSVVLMDDPQLVRENPTVVFSRAPDSALPFLDK
jgi:hypothetical protein